MSDNLQVHVSDDVQRLVVSHPRILENELVDIDSTIDSICYRICMLIRHLHLPSVQLCRFSLPVHHTKTLRDLATFTYLLKVLDQMTRLFILSFYLVHLDDLVRVFVLTHRVLQSWLANS